METREKRYRSMRVAMMLPVVLLIASIVTGCFSYSSAKAQLRDDLNDAMVTLANENRELWAQQDTVAALQQMRATIDKPIVYQATDVTFRYAALKDEAYFSLALVDCRNQHSHSMGKSIESDSIMIIPETAPEGMAIQLKGFADCSMASIISVTDMTLPGVLLALSMLTFAFLTLRRKETDRAIPIGAAPINIERLKLTPMQRRLVTMLNEAPQRRVNKAALCRELWGGKDNAEESLYTLVRRTKKALADTDMEITCNRGESYELHVKGDNQL